MDQRGVWSITTPPKAPCGALKLSSIRHIPLRSAPGPSTGAPRPRPDGPPQTPAAQPREPPRIVVPEAFKSESPRESGTSQPQQLQEKVFSSTADKQRQSSWQLGSAAKHATYHFDSLDSIPEDVLTCEAGEGPAEDIAGSSSSSEQISEEQLWHWYPGGPPFASSAALPLSSTLLDSRMSGSRVASTTTSTSNSSSSNGNHTGSSTGISGRISPTNSSSSSSSPPAVQVQPQHGLSADLLSYHAGTQEAAEAGVAVLAKLSVLTLSPTPPSHVQLQHAWAAVAASLHQLRPRQLADVAHALSELSTAHSRTSIDPLLLQQLLLRSSYWFFRPAFSGYAYATLFESLVDLQHQPPEPWLHACLASMQLRLPNFSPQSFSAVASCLPQLASTPPETEWAAAFFAASEPRLANFPGVGLARTLHGVSQWGPRVQEIPASWLRQVLAGLSSCSSTLEPREVAMVVQALQRLQQQQVVKVQEVELQAAWGLPAGYQQQQGQPLQPGGSAWHPKRLKVSRQWQQQQQGKEQQSQQQQEKEQQQVLDAHVGSLLSQLLGGVLVELPGYKPKDLTVLLFSLASMGLQPLPWWWLQPVLQAAKDQLGSCNPLEMSTCLSAAVVLSLRHLHNQQQQQQQGQAVHAQGQQQQQQQQPGNSFNRPSLQNAPSPESIQQALQGRLYEQQQRERQQRVAGLQPRPLPPQQQQQQRVVDELMQLVKDMQRGETHAQQQGQQQEEGEHQMEELGARQRSIRQQPEQELWSEEGGAADKEQPLGEQQRDVGGGFGTGSSSSSGGAQEVQDAATLPSPATTAAAGGGAAGSAAGEGVPRAAVQALVRSTSSLSSESLAAAGAAPSPATERIPAAGTGGVGGPTPYPASANPAGTLSKLNAAELAPPHTLMCSLLESFCIASLPTLESFSPEDLSISIIALANAHYVPHELWYELYLRSVHKALGELNPGQAAAVASGLARLALLPSRAAADAGLVPSEHWLQDFYHVALGAQPEGCTGSEVVRMIWGAAVLGFKPKKEWLDAAIGRVEGLAAAAGAASGASAADLSPPLLGALLQSCISLEWTPSPTLLDNLLFSPGAGQSFIAQAGARDASRVLQALGAVGVPGEKVAALGRAVAVAWEGKLGELQQDQLVLLLVGLACARVHVHSSESQRQQQGQREQQPEGKVPEAQLIGVQRRTLPVGQLQGSLDEPQLKQQQQQQGQREQQQVAQDLSKFRGAFLAATAIRMPSFTAHRIAQMLWAVCYCKLQPPREWLLLALDVLQPMLHTAEPKTLTRVIHALAVLGFRPPADWVGSFLMATQRRFSSRGALVEPQLVVKTLMALGVLGLRPSQKWLKPMLLVVHAQLWQLQPKDVSLLLVALARLGCRPSPVYLEKLLLPLNDLSPSRCSDQVLVSLAWALGKLRWRPPGVWLKGFLDALKPRLGVCSAEGLRTVLWGLAALRMGRSLSNKWRAAAASALLPKVGRMNPKLLCSLAWSLGKLRFNQDPASAIQSPLLLLTGNQQPQQQVQQQQQHEAEGPSPSVVHSPSSTSDAAAGLMLGSSHKRFRAQQLTQQVVLLHSALLCRALEVRESFTGREMVLLLVGVAEMQLQPGQQWLQQMMQVTLGSGKEAPQAAAATAAGRARHVGAAAAAAGGEAELQRCGIGTAAPLAAAGSASIAATAARPRDASAGLGGTGQQGVPVGTSSAETSGARGTGRAACEAASSERSGTASAVGGRVIRAGQHQQRHRQPLAQLAGVMLVLLLKALAQLGFRANEGWLRDVEVLMEVAWLEEERWARFSGAWALGVLKALAAAEAGTGRAAAASEGGAGGLQQAGGEE